MKSVNDAQRNIIEEQNKIILEQSKIIEKKEDEAERYRKLAHGNLKDTLTPSEIENIYLTSHAVHRLTKMNLWYILVDLLWAFQIFATIISGKTFNGAWTGFLMFATFIIIIFGIVKMVKSEIIARKCKSDGQITRSKSIREHIRLSLILCSSSFMCFVTLMMLEITFFR